MSRSLDETIPAREVQYQSLFENMLEGLAYCRMEYDAAGKPLDFTYLDVNRSFGELTGLRNVVGKRVTEVLPGIRESNPEIFEIYGRVASTGQPDKFETFLSQLGIWLSVSVYSPRTSHFVAVFENITERRRAAQALQHNEKRLEALLEHSRDQVSLVSADGTLIWESASALRALGYELNQHVGLNIFLLAHPDDEAEMRREFSALVQEPGRHYSGTFRMRHADGTWRNVEGDASNLLNDPAVGAIVLNYRDVTERKRAEEELARSEERYRQLFENNPHPMWVYERPTLKFLAVNGAAVAAYGYSREELLRMTISDIRPREDLPLLMEALARPQGPDRQSEGVRHRLKDGRLIDVRISSRPVELDGRDCALVLAEDVTETKRAEDRVLYMTRLYATISQVNEAIVRVKDRQELFQKICDVAADSGGFRLAWIGWLNRETGVVTPQAHSGDPDGYLQVVKINVNDPAGSNGPTGTAIRTGQAVFVDDVATDPNFQFWREEALARGYRSYAAIPIRENGTVIGNLALYAPEPGFFNQDEMHLLEEIGQDISFALDTMELEDRRKSLESERLDLLSTIESSLNEVFLFDPDSLHFQYVNRGALLNLGYTAEMMAELTPPDLCPEFSERQFRELIAPLTRGERPKITFETAHLRLDGSLYPVEVHLQLIRQHDHALFLAVVLDITERRRAAAELQDSERRYRDVLTHMMEGCQILDYDWRWIYVNDTAAQQTGREPQELLMHRIMDVFPGFETTELFSLLLHCMQSREARRTERKMGMPDGSARWLEFSVQPVPEGLFILSFDVTERRQAELARQQSEERFRRFFELGVVGMTITSPEKGFVEFNDRLCEMLGYTRDELKTLTWEELTYPPDLAQDVENFSRLLRGELDGYFIEKRFIHKSRRLVDVALSVNAIRSAGGRMEYAAALLEDITERQHAEKRIRQQLNRITGLRDVDRAITSSFDLRLTMNTILAQVREQLGAPAAAISILDPLSSMLNCVAASGLRHGKLEKSMVRLGQGLAGTAAMQRHAVHYSDLNALTATSPEVKALVDDGLTEYYGVPLISKGQVKGILEVFHRGQHANDQDWLEYLETLAGQAAIAIDNIQMLEGLNRSNLELAQAYDATIEGWSRALDLRDKETEGHTRRVTELTVTLARASGVPEQDLIKLRWGALMHDIGKLGVPDSILLKPGDLTEDEWVQMRKHPLLAYEMLAPIQYLRGALDIPLCHHEKWDGSGYPRGLQGEQIPLAARIFAIVDIWDALRSDRPYRLAWSAEKSLEHIRGLAGTHLDPQVVKAFFDNKIYEYRVGSS